MKELTSTIHFDSTASRPKHGLALIYDLEGFSAFFNQPDVQDYVPKFLNEVSHAMSVNIFGGEDYWGTITGKSGLGSLDKSPIHEKFMGDGAMYLWAEDKSESFTQSFIYLLCNRLWNLKTHFADVVRKSTEQIPVADLPRRIRFGLARGTIYELKRRNSQQREYIGFCINLASRLQKYCPDLGFIASARIGLSQSRLEQYGYIKVVAKHIKGFPREIVIVDGNEYEKLDTEIKNHYFDSLE
jgi:class 3 adenylate cyclase